MEVLHTGSRRNSAMRPRIFVRPPILGGVIRRNRAEFRIESPSLIKTTPPRGPMGYGRGAQSNHKNLGVYPIRINISLVTVIISDFGAIGADHGRYKLISGAAKKHKSGSALAMGRFPGGLPYIPRRASRAAAIYTLPNRILEGCKFI